MTDITLDRRGLLRSIGLGFLGVASVQAASGQSEPGGETVYVGANDGALHALDARTGERVWQFAEPDGAVRSSPTVADGTVYVGSHDGSVYAVDAETGRGEWQFDESGYEFESSPTVVEGTVYIIDNNGSLFAIDAGTGERAWKTPLAPEQEPSTVRSAPAVYEQTLFVVFNETLYAFDLNSGEPQWTYDASANDGTFRTSPMVVEDTVYIGSEESVVLAFDAETGTLRWEGETEEDNQSDSGSSCPSCSFAQPVVFFTGDITPVVADRTVYAAKNSTLYAFDAETGGKQWEFAEPLSKIGAPPTVANGTVYVGSDDGALYAVDSDSGTRLWRFDEPSAAVRSTPTVFDGRLYVGSNDGTLYALDAETGQEEWAYRRPEQPVFSSPTVVNNPGAESGVGSRAELRTLGHYVPNSTPETPTPGGTTYGPGAGSTGSGGDGTPTEMLLALVGGTTLLGTYTLMRRSGDQSDPEPGGTRRGGDPGEPPAPTDQPQTPNQPATAAAGGARTESTPRARLEDDIAEIEADLDRVAGRSDIRSTDLDDIAGRIESLRTSVADLGIEDLEGELGALEGRLQELRATQVQTGGPPRRIPSAPDLSLTHDAVTGGEQIGSGGNADVRLTTVPTADGEAPVAVKEPRLAGTLTTDMVDRLLEEARTWEQLDDHNHVVSVIDYGSEPLPWIAMEYMDGGHLGNHAGEMSFDQALWTAVAITKAVRYAHREGVVHLDLKPENILFRSVEDAWDVPKVGDWGLSKHLLNHSKSVEGFSPHYAAPEQFDEEYGQVTDLTDIYQLGVVLYELFTGRPPFEGDPARAMYKILNNDPTPPSAVADVPPALDEVILTAMATDPDDRYETVVHLRNALQQLE